MGGAGQKHYLEYTPFISIATTTILAGGLGIASYYSRICEELTVAGFDIVYGAKAVSQELVEPSIIGTNLCFAVVGVILLALSFWRGVLELSHDIRGDVSRSATAYLYCNAFFSICLWVLVIWAVLLLMGCTVWLSQANAWVGVMDIFVEIIEKSGEIDWSPDDGTASCPNSCVNLNFAGYVSPNGDWVCLCNEARGLYSKLAISNAARYIPAVMTGLFAMIVGGIGLGINMACQYSHTQVEVEMVRRSTTKDFVGI